MPDIIMDFGTSAVSAKEADSVVGFVEKYDPGAIGGRTRAMTALRTAYAEFVPVAGVAIVGRQFYEKAPDPGWPELPSVGLKIFLKELT